MTTTSSTGTRGPSRRGGVTEQAADATVDQACRMLRLPTMRARFGEVADAAQREQLTYRGFLADLLMAECDDRDRRRSARRITAFRGRSGLSDVDYNANPHIQPAVIAQLATSAWVSKGEPLCLIGDSGTGKSHLLIGLGAAAAMAGHRVKYVLAAKLVNELVEAADERQLSKTIARYGRVDLLCLDLCRPRHSWTKSGSLRWMTPAPNCCSASSPVPTNAAAWRSPRTGRSSSAAGSCPSTPPPSACSTGSCTTRPSWRPTASPTGCAKPATTRLARMRHASGPPASEGFHCASSGRFTVTAVHGLFRNLNVGSPARFCSPACRVAAWRRRNNGARERTTPTPRRQHPQPPEHPPGGHQEDRLELTASPRSGDFPRPPAGTRACPLTLVHRRQPARTSRSAPGRLPRLPATP